MESSCFAHVEKQQQTKLPCNNDNHKKKNQQIAFCKYNLSANKSKHVFELQSVVLSAF